MEGFAKEKIRAIIIDDERHNADLLFIELKENFPEVEVIKVCYGAKEGLKAIMELKPVLVFLDIEMPVMNGFEVLEFAKEVEFHVIFTTAYSDYSLQAIKTSAVDYLLKPISTEDIRNALHSFERRYFRKSTHIEFLLNQIQDLKNNKISRIALPTPDGLIFMELNKILYFQSDDVYTFLITVGGKKIFLNKTLKFIEDSLRGLPFFRVHRSYIVNTGKIGKYLKHDGGYLLMDNNDQIPLSRSRRDEFFKVLNEV